MQNRDGFFLMELLTYLALFSFLIVVLMRSLGFTTQKLNTEMQHAYALTQLYATGQLMLRQLECAPTDQSDWYCMQDDQIVWHVGDKEIGWCFEDNTLMRKEGRYDHERQQWIKKKSIVGAKQISEGQFALEWSTDKLDPQLEFIAIKIKTQKGEHTFCVCPRNRIIA